MEENNQLAEHVLDKIKQYSITSNFEKEISWDNSYIKKQINTRNGGGTFDMEDHIRAMIYAMLSSGRRWNCLISNAEDDTRRHEEIDEIFYDFKADKLLKVTSEELLKRVKDKKIGNRQINKQIFALRENIEFLIRINKDYKSIDDYYHELNGDDETFWKLVNALANTKVNKLHQLGVPLVCEYLRNVGYDIGKPDRHIRRIVSKKYLGFLDKDLPSQKEVYELLWDLRTDKWYSVAEIDYYLWSFCADGYMEICTRKRPQCIKCVLNSFCNGYVN